MSSYPVLNNRPIDQWRVTDLKDELRKRRLPVKGLKDELVRRLFDSIQSEKAVEEANEHVEVNPAANEAPEIQNVRQEVHKETVVQVTEEAAPPITDISQPLTVSAVEDPPEVNVVATYEAPVSEAPTTKPEEPQSIAGDFSTVQKEHLHSESNAEPFVEAPQDDGTNKTIDAHDMTSADVESDMTSSDVKTDATEAGKVQHQTVSATVDAIPTDADPMDTDAATEKMVLNDLSENTSMYDEERKDSELTNEDGKPITPKPNDQVPEVSPDLGSPIKCESISSDDISTNKQNNIKDNLNANNFDLELEAKPEMVKPSSGITSIGGDLQPLDDDKELDKNQSSLEYIDSTANVDEGGSPEKLNLDRSSGDESMEEDVMEVKQVESNIKSEGNTELSSDHVKEVSLPDSVVDGSSVDTKEVIAEEKTAASTEKRKLEAEETIAPAEPIKRQRRWTADGAKVPERQPLSHSGSDAPKENFQPALRRSFGRSDSTASEDSPKERVVPPPQNPATTSLRIDRFVRPFTLKAVQELLGKTGSVCSFWMDHIKTHCYVTYSSLEEAVATRDAVYNLQWPPNNGNRLVAEFVDPQEVKLKLEPPPPAATPTSPATPFQQAQTNQNVPRQAAAPRENLPPPPPLTKPPTTDPGSTRERLPPTPKKQPEPPVVTLDDLFRKTQSSPRIYYLPLSEEEVAAKLASQGKGKRE
ncbi:fibrous sheath CABYR-binding protein-like [Oryza brachyantha]|nr:fibrous sheath CABYR-binding protein-like [Oryza brachyantha]XP_015690990.1 fibrous sheath CABYR-binding protein-like [Oryza brachyantha]XP_015690991.1 fibrous sheath CABYR-binding protein-like [Oryza brachyantha]